MTKKVSLVANYGLQDDCPWVLFELSKSEVLPGSTVEIRLWAAEQDMLIPYVLYKGAQNWGVGSYTYYSSNQCEEELDFAEKSVVQVKRPVFSIVSANAVSDVMYIDENTNLPVVWASMGSDVTARLVQSGGSCFSTIDGHVLYGTIRCKYIHAPWKRYWTWTVGTHDTGTHWFFWYKNGELNHKFSVQLPDWAGEFSGELKDVLLKVVDSASKGSIKGAKVYLNGVHKCTTNASGECIIYNVPPGTYDLKITATGYMDSDKDSLANDILEVAG